MIENRNKPMERRIFTYLLPLLIVIGVWQLVAWVALHIKGVPFPTPLMTVLKLASLAGGHELTDHSLYRHVADSLIRWFLGFGIAAVAGVSYGLVAGWSRPVESATYRILHILQLVPGLAWIPVAILVFGIGETATIFMIAVTAFTPIALNVHAGVKQLDATLVRAALMMGADRATMLTRVLLPGALPEIISGLRIGLGNGWRVLVAAEMIVGTGTGLGYSIIQARWTLDYPAAFACLGVICVIGLIFEQLIFNPLERHTVARWALSRDER